MKKLFVFLAFVVLCTFTPQAFGQNCSGKTYPTTKTAANICFPQGDISFADEVVSFNIGSPHSTDNQYGDNMTNAQEAVGIPNSRQAENKWNAVALGANGSLTVKFTNNALVDVPGMDIYVFEVGSNVEATRIEISKDGRNWVNVGNIEGGTRGLDIGGKVRPGEEFYFVRLTDLNANSTRPIGADIDAIGAIGSVRKNSSQVPKNPGGSSNNSGGKTDDGSVDLGKVIMDKIRNRNKKPDNNSNDNNNSSSDGCVFKETFTIPKGQNRYVKDYQISLGKEFYRIEFAQNLPRDRMHPGFGIGFFNNRTDPTGEHWTKYIEGGSHSNNVRDKDPNIAYWTWATREQPEGKFRAGEFARSDNFKTKNYTTLRISYFQGVAAGSGATGKYEIRIIGPGCKASGSASGNSSNTPNNDPQPTSQGSRTVKIFLYKPKKGETRCYTNLVAVNRQVSGSQSVLKETLNTLFATNGSEEIENYTAGLSLVSLNIRDGVADIVLTGAQNSPCASLFEEQVRKTAMQFPTVKNVRISFK